jgi:ABC-type oligopeptide transport system substrate-binding subunit
MHQKGQLNVSSSVSALGLLKLVALGDAQILPEPAMFLYMFNCTRKTFNDVRVHKTLTLAINRQRIVDSVPKGGGAPVLPMVLYGIVDATPDTHFHRIGGSYFKDNHITTAKALLAQVCQWQSPLCPHTALQHIQCKQIHGRGDRADVEKERGDHVYVQGLGA